MDGLYLIASTGFLFWIGRNTLYWIYLFQEHEYSQKKLQRTVVVFRSTLLFSPLSLVKWVLLFLYPLVVFYESFLSSYHLLITILYICECLIVFREILQFSYSYQKLSLKSLIIIIATIGIAVTLFLFPPLDKFLWLVIVDRVLFFIIVLLALVAMVPEEFYRDYQESVVQKKLLKYSPKIILLIGSIEMEYVKHILSNVFSKKHSVIVTPPSSGVNDIVQSILRSVKQSDQILIADLSHGSLRDIEQIITMLSPEVVIVNALESFGVDIKNTDSTRSVLEKIFAKRRVYINSDNDFLRHVVKRRKKHIKLYSSEKTASVSIRDIALKKEGQTFSVESGTEIFKITSANVAPGTPSLFLPVIKLFEEIGFSKLSIQQGIKQSLFPKNIAHYSERNGVGMVNNAGDTFPENLISYETYLRLFQKKKILVLDADWSCAFPTDERCIALGKFISQEYDYVFLTPSEGARTMKNKIREWSKSCVVVAATAKEIATYLEETTEKGDLIFYQGRKTEQIFNWIHE